MKEILSTVQTKISMRMLVFTDCFKIYDGLDEFEYKQHFRIKHPKEEFEDGENYTNGIENFFGFFIKWD